MWLCPKGIRKRLTFLCIRLEYGDFAEVWSLRWSMKYLLESGVSAGVWSLCWSRESSLGNGVFPGVWSLR